MKAKTAGRPESVQRVRQRDLRRAGQWTLLPDLAFRFQDVLSVRAASGSMTKGERTLLRLKAGTAVALQNVPYQSLRIADIVAEAGVSHGLFYHYFKDKEQISIDVLDEMLVYSEAAYRTIHAFSDQYESLFVPNLFYLEVYRLNAGLMRACLTLAEEVEAFRLKWNESVDRWHRRIAQSIRAHGESNRMLPDEDLVAYAVGGMIDQLGRLIFVQNNPFVGRLADDVAHLAETVTILWYRAVYGRDPTTEQIESCRSRYGADRGLLDPPRQQGPDQRWGDADL